MMTHDEEMAHLRREKERADLNRIVARSATPPEERFAVVAEENSDPAEDERRSVAGREEEDRRERDDIDREVERTRAAYVRSMRVSRNAWDEYDAAYRRKLASMG